MGLTDFQLLSTGEPIRLTYSELVTLRDTSKLDIGRQYITIDTRTKYSQPVTGVLKEAPIEELIHIALGINKLSTRVYSVDYPQDIINYDIDDNVVETSISEHTYTTVDLTPSHPFPVNIVTDWSGMTGVGATTTLFLKIAGFSSACIIYTDSAFSNAVASISISGTGIKTVTELNASGYGGTVIGAAVPGDSADRKARLDITNVTVYPSRTGKIYYREDTITGNNTGYDWRHVFFARFKCNHNKYNSTITYVEKDLIRIAGDGIYISVENNNFNNAPASSPNKWYKILDLSNTAYLGTTTNVNNISFDITDYIEVPTFWILGEETNTTGIVNGTGVYGGMAEAGFYNYTIKSTYIAENILNYWGGDASTYSYCNTVFMLIPDWENETFAGFITIGTSRNTEELALSKENTFIINNKQSNIYINTAIQNIGDFSGGDVNINIFMNNTIYNSKFEGYFQKIISNYFFNTYISGILNISNSILYYICNTNNLISINNCIIDNLCHIFGDELSNLNLKDATIIKTAYTKQLFIDTASTLKLSYIDSSNTIQYVLPTA